MVIPILRFLAVAVVSLMSRAFALTTRRIPTVRPTAKLPAVMQPPPVSASTADSTTTAAAAAPPLPVSAGERRELDAVWTKPPTPNPTDAPRPTRAPTKFPTGLPTKRPTRAPVTPTRVPVSSPDTCGTIVSSATDGYDLLLGPYTRTNAQRTASDFDCNNENGYWYSKSIYMPTKMYKFRLTKKCEYQFQHPDFSNDYAEHSDINAWFDQAAIIVKRQNNAGYRASDDDIIFNGIVVPNFSYDVTYTGNGDVPTCPEDYCLRIFGPAVGRRSDATINGYSMNADLPDPELLYAFSNEDAMLDFKEFTRALMRANAKDKIFLTNHFQRCGCESFCYEQFAHWNTVVCRATCYTEHVCGSQRVYKIQYKSNYPEEEKASWHQTGTTEVMEWFNECAKAMFSCDAVPEYDDHSLYKGTLWNHNYHPWPKVTLQNNLEVSPLPKATYVGDHTDPNFDTLLGECEGDCDEDSDCEGERECFQREAWEAVPGCSGYTDAAVDYCITRPMDDPNTPVLTDVPAGHVFGTLQQCEGNCVSHWDCEGSLKCKTRNDLRPVRGCSGLGTWGVNYCYKNRDPMPTMAPTAPLSMLSFDHIYALSGNRFYGFPHSNNMNTIQLAWTCQAPAHRNELKRFGEFIQAAEFARDDGQGEEVPDVPCTEDHFYEPVYPDLDTFEGPECEDLNGNDFCYEMPGATCYTQADTTSCTGQKYFMKTATGTTTYTEVGDWTDACLATGNGCDRIPSYAANKDGTLTKHGVPDSQADYDNSLGWRFQLKDRKRGGLNTVVGNKKKITYDCNNWLGAYRSVNFTQGAGDMFDNYGIANEWGDMYSAFCTDAPSMTPSETPSVSNQPSDNPSLQPSFCAESYLTSEDLNIALVMDVSYSTYEKSFSSTNPVGDLNNDGKANTILDAQVAAIQELMVAISKSDLLRNDNCEINLISFSTDAKDEGTWLPLNDDENSYNNDLMNHLKSIRAPTSADDVFETNNGFTNFDAALDVAVDYFQNRATPDRKNLIVFMSDGEPNVRGDGDNEGYCADTVTFWNGDGGSLACADLGLAPGEPHTFCTGNDPGCTENEPYQDCVRGPNECMNGDAVTQYASEINALNASNVERLSIGIGGDSNVAWGSGLWIIDNNPAKYLGVLPLQALDLDELTEYLSSLCILNTEKPTGSPSAAPSPSPTASFSPSNLPSTTPTHKPTLSPTQIPSDHPSATPTLNPTPVPTSSPSNYPSQTPTKYLNTCRHGGGTRFYVGELNMCLRTSLGYTSPISGNFQEVNFIESLIRIQYDTSTGFCVLAFAVAPKEREITTIDQQLGGLEAYICDPDVLTTRNTPQNNTRRVPAEVTDYNVPGNTKTFHQGSLITVCVFPDGESYDEGLVMSGIEEFFWVRDPHPLHPDVRDPLRQPAIENHAPSGNFLTSFVAADCAGANWCRFSSVLFADFYANPGNATGVGSAALRWDLYANGLFFSPSRKKRRRRRRLTGDGGETTTGGNDGTTTAQPDDLLLPLPEDDEARRLQVNDRLWNPDPPPPRRFDTIVRLQGENDGADNSSDRSGGSATTTATTTARSTVWLVAALLLGATLATTGAPGIFS